MDAVETLLGDLLQLAMDSTCGTRNSDDRLLLEGQFGSKLEDLQNAMDQVTFGGIPILTDGYDISIAVWDYDGEWSAPGEVEVTIPAMGFGLLFGLENPTIVDQSSAQNALTSIGDAYGLLADHRASIQGQFDALMGAFGCENVYVPIAQSPPPTSRAELLSQCEACEDSTASLNSAAIAGYEQIENALVDMRNIAVFVGSGDASSEEVIDAEEDFQFCCCRSTPLEGTPITTDIPCWVTAAIWWNLPAFHSGIRNTIHNVKAHMYHSQSTMTLFESRRRA